MPRVLTIAGVGLMGLVLVASLIRAGQKLSSGTFVAAAAPSIAATSAAVGDDGVQRVQLGFGKFNYSPDTIRVRKDIPVEIVADRSLSGCFNTFVIPELNVWKQFTVTDRSVAFTPRRVGAFRFSCAMGMGAGRLIVEG